MSGRKKQNGMSTDESLPSQAAWRTALLVVGAVTLLRISLLFLNPLQLYPDEAQYWVWSRHLAFGYFSKPPMIAWLIRLTTSLGGQGEAWVRLSAPILHAGAALALCRAGGRLYGDRAGLWSALIYTLIPGVQLSSAIMSTDAPLMLFVSLAVWAYAAFWRETTPTRRRWAAAAMGAALGAAFLTKYASLYIAGGVLLHGIVSRDARRRWDPVSIALYAGLGLLFAAPNLVWNAIHHFQTVAHTAENADLGDEKAGLKGLFGQRGPFGYLLGQFGVFGPVPFAIALMSFLAASRRRAAPADVLLVCLAAPALLIVFGESIAARANANWAGAAYPPAAALTAGVLDRWSRRRLFAYGVVGLQAAAAAGFLLVLLSPWLVDRLGAGNAFKRARGWREDAAAVVAATRTSAASAPLTAIAVDDRFLFNALSYYARDGSGRPAGALPAPLRMWVRLAKPANQAETEAPLTRAYGARVFGVSASWFYLIAFRHDFSRVTMGAPVTVRLDRRHQRKLDMFIGEDFQPRPRDPLTGLPIPPGSDIRTVRDSPAR